jgi:hypothetical protein
MKFVERHSFADPDAAARKVIEIANGVEAAQDGRIFIERVNDCFWRMTVVARNSVPVSSAPLLSIGFGGTRAAPT